MTDSMADNYLNESQIIRYIFAVEYCGKNFYGWQFQPQRRTIQGEIYSSINKFLGLSVSSASKHTIFKVAAAGRTDRGVHARNQLIQVDFSQDLQEKLESRTKNWVRGLNHLLPHDIRILFFQKVKGVNPKFDVRRSAIKRQYKYFLLSQKIPPTINCGMVGYTHKALNLDAMCSATKYLIGTHNFTSFRDSQCQAKNPERTIYEFEVSKINNLFIFSITANAFLHHMVRNIVGAFVEVGLGAQSSTWIKKILNLGDRKNAAVTFMADGLYLWRVYYPEGFITPANVQISENLSLPDDWLPR